MVVAGGGHLDGLLATITQLQKERDLKGELVALPISILISRAQASRRDSSTKGPTFALLELVCN